jgi:hypothetical protein
MYDVRETEPQRQGGTERHSSFSDRKLALSCATSPSIVASPPSYDFGGQRAKADALKLRHWNKYEIKDFKA